MRMHQIAERSRSTQSRPLIEAEAPKALVYSLFRLNTGHPTTVALKNDGVRIKAVPDATGGIRHVISTIGQLPLRPFLAVLVASLMLGSIPMLATAIYSAVRALADVYRRAFLTRTAADQTLLLNPWRSNSRSPPRSSSIQ